MTNDNVSRAAEISTLNYETPQLVEFGDVVELTRGSGADDTADMMKYYY
jgi:hypothetical protein